MKSFFIGIIKTIGWSALAIWCLLTALVIVYPYPPLDQSRLEEYFQHRPA